MRPNALMLATLLVATSPAHALFGVGDIVYDPANHAQNVLTAARMAESVINEARMIQNQLNQYQNMVEQGRQIRNGEWSNISSLLGRLASTMEQGDSIAYSMNQSDQVFHTTFPGYQPPQSWQDDYRSWARRSLDTIRGVMRSLGIHNNEYSREQARIRVIQAMSENAVGRMQALQAANMLASEEVQSLGKLRQLMMMQMNQQSVYYAHQINSDAAREANTQRWLNEAGRDSVPEYGSQGFGQMPDIRR